MTTDYAAIKNENVIRYGTEIDRIGSMLLANRYDDRSHFIFELLQNAEDALKRREIIKKSRSITFVLSENSLRVSHYGTLFTEQDVRGISGIGEGTKSDDLTAIGCFGIGFKAVYAFTDSPEIHSGEEHFAIDSFVWPRTIEPAAVESDETAFIFPFRSDDETAFNEISYGLQKLGARTLLFLREIEEINWSVEGGQSGLYLRDKAEPFGKSARKVLIVGQIEGQEPVEEKWLIFSKEAKDNDGNSAGYVEIAFALDIDDSDQSISINRVPNSNLVVFFPTIISTELGFFIQGPYRTTPSRDNVPRSDPWNQWLVKETAMLLVEALRWLCDHDSLDVATLRCLPLDAGRFGEGSMFAPLYEATRQALASEPLLPRFNGGHVAAKNASLSRTNELRELINSTQLAALLDSDKELTWLSEEITHDLTPDLQQYLIQELGITEFRPETIIPKLNKVFLEAQSDNWILKLYEFMNGRKTLVDRIKHISLVRLKDGTHVVARSNGKLQAFLPSAIETSFPTVRRAVCATNEAREFLESLGVTEPDPVDDVVWNVLPKYNGDDVDLDDTDYTIDINRIIYAFGTDSNTQREKLIEALREAPFVKVVDAGDGSKRVSKPSDVYLATDRLRELFEGVTGVLLVDVTHKCLRGEESRELLEACGVSRTLKPISIRPDFTFEQRNEMRRKAGHEYTSGRKDQFKDWSLLSFDPLLAIIPTLPVDLAKQKAELLWEALGDVESRRGHTFFSGNYQWTDYGSYSCEFPSSFVRKLNETTWIPDANGDLQRPEFVLFEILDWKPNPFLQSKIRFKPPIIETLAKEAGIEPGIIDLLKKYNITSEAELRNKLGIIDEPEDKPGPETVDAAVKGILGGAPPPPPPPTDLPPESGHSGGGNRGTGGGLWGRGYKGDGRGGGKRTPGSAGGRPFISYIGAHPNDNEPDPDGLDHQKRIELEEKAIQFILKREPQLQRTPAHNPGFDLFEKDEDGHPSRWIEVKAMTCGFNDRPVGLSRTQFECAREQGEAYWLYVVEYAGEDSKARIVRIQDPAGKARTFTFDHGWLSVAEVSDHSESKAEQ